MKNQAGLALLAVLVMMLIVASTSASFIWFMNQQQTRAGTRLRAAGRTWRPTAHTERLGAGPLEGRFTLSLADDPGGAVLITSVGEVGGVARRLRARVYLASPALLAALHGASVVRLESPPAATFLLPYGAGIGDRPWIHIAAGHEIWFKTTDVSINSPDVAIEVAPGPVDAPDGANSATALPRPGPVRLLLPRSGALTLDANHRRVDVEHLRSMGVFVEGVVLRAEALPPLPEVDRAFYQTMAAANTRNAALNEAAGNYLGDADLAYKRDSLYSRREFDQMQAYLKAGLSAPRFEGVVYINGGVVLLEGQRMEVVDGALITDSTVHISQGATLQVTHSASTRTLPGLIVLDNGGLTVTHEARLRVHGLVYVNRIFDVGQGGHVDIVGTVLGNDPDHSFRNLAATVVIRYDPAVLGTPGLRVAADAPVVAWVAAWEELP